MAEQQKKLFVSNFKFSATEEELGAWFQQRTNLRPVKVEIILNRETRQSRGFGFITIENAGDIDFAIAQTNGCKWEGRALTVNQAKPREPHVQTTGR